MLHWHHHHERWQFAQSPLPLGVYSCFMVSPVRNIVLVSLSLTVPILQYPGHYVKPFPRATSPPRPPPRPPPRTPPSYLPQPSGVSRAGLAGHRETPRPPKGSRGSRLAARHSVPVASPSVSASPHAAAIASGRIVVSALSRMARRSASPDSPALRIREIRRVRAS